MAGGTRVYTVYTSTALAAVVALCVGINVGIFIARKPEAKGSGSITPEMLDKAAKRVERAGVAFRAQIINQRLYIEDIKALWFLRDYTPSRVQMLVEVLRRHKVPDLEAVFNSGDYPVMLVPRNPKHMTDLYDDLKPPPIFSPTANIISFDLPWPDFRAPKADLSFAAADLGGFGEQAKEHTDSIFVNEIFIKTPTGRKNCIEEGLAKRGGHQKDACGIPFEDLCRFKYLINVGSNGYANKLKYGAAVLTKYSKLMGFTPTPRPGAWEVNCEDDLYRHYNRDGHLLQYLFLCKSVVIFVRTGAPNWEFFEHQFMPGRDYISVPTPEDVPAAISMLRSNEGYAQEVASQGTARMTQMDLEEIT
eukprot:gene16657-19789_t